MPRKPHVRHPTQLKRRRLKIPPLHKVDGLDIVILNARQYTRLPTLLSWQDMPGRYNTTTKTHLQATLWDYHELTLSRACVLTTCVDTTFSNIHITHHAQPLPILQYDPLQRSLSDTLLQGVSLAV